MFELPAGFPGVENLKFTVDVIRQSLQEWDNAM